MLKNYCHSSSVAKGMGGGGGFQGDATTQPPTPPNTKFKSEGKRFGKGMVVSSSSKLTSNVITEITNYYSTTRRTNIYMRVETHPL